MKTQRKTSGDRLLRITLALALLLLGTMLSPKTVLADDTPITEVSLTVGATYGSSVADVLSTVSVPDSATYYATGASVLDADYNDVTSGNLISGSTYYIRVNLAAVTNYCFKGEPQPGGSEYTGTLLVNGSDAFRGTWSGYTDESSSMTVTYILTTFLDNVSVTVGNISVGDEIATVADKISIPNNVNYSFKEVKVYTYDNNYGQVQVTTGNFADKTRYNLYITLESASGCLFTTDYNRYIGGATINNKQLSQDDKIAGSASSIDLKYDLLLGLTYIQSVSFKVEAPEAGKTPQKTATTTTLPEGSVTSEATVDLIWYKSDVEITEPEYDFMSDDFTNLTKMADDEVFANDKCYYVRYKSWLISPTAADGYLLDISQNTKLKINGLDSSNYPNGLISFCHTWGEPTYSWSDDGKKCVAKIHCTTDGCKGEVSEEGVITPTVKEAAAIGKKGTTTYTATFSHGAFTTQTKDVEDIPALEPDPVVDQPSDSGEGTKPQETVTVTAPAKVTLKTLKNSKKGTVTIKLKTKKTDPKVDGYEVISATSKKKLSRVKKAKIFKKATIKLTKLKKGKTYYIKVRAYKLDGKKKVYGKWSSIKAIRIKK